MKTSINQILTAVLFLGILAINACKDEEKETDKNKPVITIAEPMANDTITDELHIEYTVTDDIELVSTQAIVTDEVNKELFNQNKAIDGLKVFAFHEHFHVHGLTEITSANVKITARDKSGNETEVTVPVVIKP